MILGLRILENRVVQSAIYVEDYFQLHFGPGAVLTINNPINLTGPVAESLSSIRGLRISSIEESDEKAILRFGDGSSIDVDLRDEAYQGPEAMVLDVPGIPTLVWN